MDIDDAMNILDEAGLRLSFNMRRELIELTTDIAIRDDMSCLEALDSLNIRSIANNSKISAPDRIKRIKETLYEKRYPSFHKTLNAYEMELKKLDLDKSLKITHQPFFESNEILVEFKYNDPDKLVDIIRSLKKLSKVDIVKNALESPENNC